MKSMFFKYAFLCRRVFFGLVLCLGIYAGIFIVFRVPLEMIWYPVLLCLVVGVVLFLSGFLSFWRRHKELRRIKEKIAFLWNELPSPEGPLEADYQSLVFELGRLRGEEYGK